MRSLQGASSPLFRPTTQNSVVKRERKNMAGQKGEVERWTATHTVRRTPLFSLSRFVSVFSRPPPTLSPPSSFPRVPKFPAASLLSLVLFHPSPSSPFPDGGGGGGGGEKAPWARFTVVYVAVGSKKGGRNPVIPASWFDFLNYSKLPPLSDALGNKAKKCPDLANSFYFPLKHNLRLFFSLLSGRPLMFLLLLRLRQRGARRKLFEITVSGQQGTRGGLFPSLPPPLSRNEQQGQRGRRLKLNTSLLLLSPFHSPPSRPLLLLLLLLRFKGDRPPLAVFPRP